MATAPSDALKRLIDVVAQLRNPTTGCPWDLEQTHTSLVPYVLEEAHEVADAIRHGDDEDLKEELGDLLLQVVLHAQIAGEAQRFDLDAIATGISDKLIRRHPHVFGDAKAKSSEDVRRSWEAIKMEEQAATLNSTTSPLSDRLRSKVRGLPALAGAMTISKKSGQGRLRVGRHGRRLGESPRGDGRTQGSSGKRQPKPRPGGTWRSSLHPGQRGALVPDRSRGRAGWHQSEVPRPFLTGGISPWRPTEGPQHQRARIAVAASQSGDPKRDRCSLFGRDQTERDEA